MDQQTFNFDYPKPESLFAYDNQDRRLYEAMTYGPVTNAQMRDQLRLLSYTRRLSDLREKLHPLGWAIKKEHVGNGVFAYSLARIERKAA